MARRWLIGRHFVGCVEEGRVWVEEEQEEEVSRLKEER